MTNFTEERLINARDNKTTLQYGKPLTLNLLLSKYPQRNVAKSTASAPGAMEN